MTRSRTASGEIEARLTQAALTVLALEGPQALSIRHVAHVAEVAPMGIYARFHSKAGLTLHVLAEGFARLQTAIATTGPTAREALRRSGVAYRVFAHEHPALYRLMFAQKLTFDDATLADVVRSAGLEAFGTLVELARAYLDEAAITTFDPVDVAMLFWSVVHGFVSLELDDHQFGDDHDANFVCLLEVALEGVRVTHAR